MIQSMVSKRSSILVYGLVFSFWLIHSLAYAAQANSTLILDKKSSFPIDQYLVNLGEFPLGTSPKIVSQYFETAVSTTIGDSSLTNDNTLTHAQWYKLTLKNSSEQPKQWLIGTGLIQAPLLRVWSVSASSTLSLLLDQNIHTPFHQRPFPSRLLIIPLYLEAYESIDIIFQYQSVAKFPLFASIIDEATLVKRSLRYELANGVTLGIIFILLLFFFLQFIIKPSQRLGFYCLLVLSVGIFIAQITGYFFEFIWPNNGEFNIRFNSVIGTSTYVWYFLFAAALFNLKTNNRALYYLILAASVLSASAALLAVILDISNAVTLLALFVLPVPVIVGIWAFKNRLPSSAIFLAGSCLHCSFTYVFVLTCLGFDFGLHRQITAIVGMGQLVDICLFAGALVYQTKILRDQLNSQLIQRLNNAEELAAMEREKSISLAKLQDYMLQLAATTHDLTQPIASIKMVLSVVDDNESKAAKQKMETALLYTENLLRSILDSTKKEYFETQETLPINDLLTPLIQRYEEAAKRNNIKLKCFYGNCKLNCSPVVINRIMDNLVSNALRYTISGSVLVSARKRQSDVLLQVWDTGPGIADIQLKGLSVPYKQLQQAQVNGDGQGNGSGLGLYIVKSLCSSAGFKFTVHSTVGKGSCFSVRIPQLSKNIGAI